MENTEYENQIVCPYCGHKDNNSWEFSGSDGEELEHDCPKCGKTMICCRNVQITYSTYRKEGEDEEDIF
jgi:predicted RNA-binding Zn-ribbon protein involved in translation (DUF1610 family)|nr:MAG TPA: hypothetical protein [Caudoviricetes sp.]